MPPPFRFVAVFILLTLGGVAAESTPAPTPAAPTRAPTPTPPAPVPVPPPPRRTSGIAREAIKDFKFQPKEALPVETSAVLLTAEEKPVMLPTYTVRGSSDRTYLKTVEAFDQLERLKSPALKSTERVEILFPPKMEIDRAGDPRLRIDILNLRF
jgi:hypothetical protein